MKHTIEIPQSYISKWQNITDIIADVMNVPVALIMRVEHPHIEVFVSSKTANNPYHVGDSEELPGLYCETVLNSNSKLLVPNALIDKNWDSNPDIKLNMISYLGYPIHQPDGEMFGTICVLDSKENHYSEQFERLLLQFRDVIETHIQLIFQNQELNELIESKNRFFHLLSHDLRGPISSMNDMLQIIKDLSMETSSDKLKEYSSVSLESSKNTLALLENLLTWAKNDQEGIVFQPERIILHEIIQLNFEHQKTFADQKSIDLISEIRKDTLCYTDLNMLNLVLRNLISNAIKFTSPNGKVIVSAQLDQDDFISISVKDNGIGMSQEQLDQLFLFGASTKGTQNEKGTGIGLTLCKEFVEKGGGKIWAESTSNEGTTFFFTIRADK